MVVYTRELHANGPSRRLLESQAQPEYKYEDSEMSPFRVSPRLRPQFTQATSTIDGLGLGIGAFRENAGQSNGGLTVLSEETCT